MTPPRRRTGLVIGLVAGALALMVCLGGLTVVGMQLLNSETGPQATNNPGEPLDPVSHDPFADTPAASFAAGAAGIDLPAPQAVGDFSADEVAETLELVRDVMIATRIDHQMLVDHDPSAMLQLMATDNQDYLLDDFESGEFAYFATQLADGAELLVAEPRVAGDITFEATVDGEGIRVIEVVTSFVWAYAFVVPDVPEIDGVVVLRDQVVWQVPHPDDVRLASQGLWLWQGQAYAWGIDCDAFDLGFIGPQHEPQFGFGGPRDENQMFDPDASLDLPDTC